MTDLGIEHVGSLEELRLGGARHQASDGDAAVGDLGAQGEGEGIKERLGGVVDGLVSTRHEARD